MTVRVSNEFGLWRQSDWRTAARSDTARIVVSGARDASRAFTATAATVGPDARAVVRVTCGASCVAGTRVALRVAVRATRGCFNCTSTLECLSDHKGVKKERSIHLSRP